MKLYKMDVLFGDCCVIPYDDKYRDYVYKDNGTIRLYQGRYLLTEYIPSEVVFRDIESDGIVVVYLEPLSIVTVDSHSSLSTLDLPDKIIKARLDRIKDNSIYYTRIQHLNIECCYVSSLIKHIGLPSPIMSNDCNKYLN